MDCKPKVVITCNGVKRGAKVIKLKQIVDAALKDTAQNGWSVGNNSMTHLFFTFKISGFSNMMYKTYRLMLDVQMFA